MAGGMESMTNAPFLIPKARDGSRLGDTPMLDSMIHDGLWSSFHDHHMGEGTDIVSRELGIDREEQDAWSARSHARAAEAWDAGRLAEEVVAVEVPQRKGDPVVFDRDEGIRPDTSAGGARRAEAGVHVGRDRHGRQRVADLRRRGGGRRDERGGGRAPRPAADRRRSRRTAWRPGAYSSLQTVPALAIEAALKRAGLDAGDLGLVEINEAFAAVAVHAARMLGIGEDIVNVNGGAIALGHPIGASGARLVLTLAHGDAPPRRRPRCGGALRRRRTGRRADHPTGSLRQTSRWTIDATSCRRSWRSSVRSSAGSRRSGSRRAPPRSTRPTSGPRTSTGSSSRTT